MASSGNDDRNENTFVLPKTIQFGFHPVCSHQMRVSEDGITAEKKDPASYYAHGVVYGAKPLRGTQSLTHMDKYHSVHSMYLICLV